MTSPAALTPPYGASDRRVEMQERYPVVRAFTERMIETLEPEDCVIQSMPDASPLRWHLAHTTWFFETFALKQMRGYRPLQPHFEHLFNSYYNSVGDPFPRPRRGLLSRPTVAEVLEYRRAVDEKMSDLLATAQISASLLGIVELGLHHEQQHQELMFTDIKHVFSCNPLLPAYRDTVVVTAAHAPPAAWFEFGGGVVEIGFAGDGFAYDNESPRHRVYLEPFTLRNRPVTCGEYLEFIDDGGYRRPELWLSLGWNFVEQEGWTAPLYWSSRGRRWYQFTLGGEIELDESLPVCHVSYFEADAFARWAEARLPTEAEWEVAAAGQPLVGNFADVLLNAGWTVHPSNRPAGDGSIRHLFGDVWEWTSSPYTPYPGYEPPRGALGEYNGKFMCNQYVLRGGSCATPSGHIRKTYRNFFPPEARWQFSGIRLARG